MLASTIKDSISWTRALNGSCACCDELEGEDKRLTRSGGRWNGRGRARLEMFSWGWKWGEETEEDGEVMLCMRV